MNFVILLVKIVRAYTISDWKIIQLRVRMTISYTAEVATSSFSCFLKLLARWRGSIYKLLWRDFAAFALIYFFLSFLYRFVFNNYQKRVFELIARYCESNNALIPVAFILGFYVTLIMTRYWNCLGHIPWPDHMAMYVTANVQGLDDRGRMMRRTMLRYLCLAYTMTMAAISPSVKKRFPTFEHMVQAGLLTCNEKKSLEQIDTPHNKFFIPLAWTTRLVNMARKERRIEDEFALKTLIDEINQFRMHLATLFVYDWITVPLVYTQVVTVAVYMFFLACLMGRQFLTDDPEVPDMYFPLFTFLEYFFYMGWLKVAECLVNPFGEDEEDFDVNFLIDRNLQVAYIIVDEVYNEPPDLVRDQYWNETHFEMPYTAASEPFRKQPHLGSTADISRSVKELDLGGAGREEMDTIQEAGSMDELDSEFGGAEGSAPRPSFFQSPITATGNALRRLLSRQESRSYSRPTYITMSHKKLSGSPSGPQSPTTSDPPHHDELQFPLEDDENLLIDKPKDEPATTTTEPIPMRRIRPSSPAFGSGRVTSRTSAQMEHALQDPSSTSPMKSSSSEHELKVEGEKKTPEATPQRPGITEVPTTSGGGAIPIGGRPRSAAISIPTTLGVSEGRPISGAFPATSEAAAAPPRSDVIGFPTTFPATTATPPPPASSVGSTAIPSTTPLDIEKAMIDFTDEMSNPESPQSPEPTSPTSPDPSDPIWVLASSRFNLATQNLESEKTRKTDENV